MRSLSPLPPHHLAQTLAPPLARVEAGDEVLSCRDLFNAVFMSAVDPVFSAAAIGVFRRQVREREIGLLGMYAAPSSSSSVVNKTRFLPLFQSVKAIHFNQK